jgi:hypothetical protein
MRKLALLFALSSALIAADRGKSAAWDDSYTIVPHIACGGGWTTTMTVVNASAFYVEPFQLRFYDDNGLPVNFQVTGAGMVPAVSGSAPIHGSLTYEFANCATLITGWAELSATDIPYILTTFRQTGHGTTPDFEAVVPITSYQDDRLAIAFNNTGVYTGAIAVVNPEPVSTTYRVELYDGSGNLLQNAANLTLAGKAHQAFVIKTLFPKTAGKSGTLRLYTNTGRVAAFGLIFNDSGAFTSAPSMPGTEPNSEAQ